MMTFTVVLSHNLEPTESLLFFRSSGRPGSARVLKHTAGQWIDSQYVYETVTLDYATNSFFCGFVFIPTDCGLSFLL